MLKFERLGGVFRATVYRHGAAVGSVLCDGRVAEELAAMHAALVARGDFRQDRLKPRDCGFDVLPPRQVVKVGSRIHRLNLGNRFGR